MTHAELHARVRELVRGRGHTFLVSVESFEAHLGRIELKWRIVIFIDGEPRVAVRSSSAEHALQIATDLLSDPPIKIPPELVGIGAPPEWKEPLQ